MEQNLSQYRIFHEVARTGNISKAAKELYISQPAISKAISKLEDNLNTALFIRNSRGVQLTEEGLLLYEHTQAAFEQLSIAEQELKRIRDFQIGHIQIGASNTLCRYVLTPHLKRFIEAYPHMKITIKNQASNYTLGLLEQQKIDVGVVVQPSSSKALSFHPLLEMEDIFVATPSYLENLRLREGDDVNIFETGHIMLLSRDNITRRYIDDYMAAHHIEINNILEVSTMDLIIEFAKIGLGIGGVIREFVLDELQSGQLVEIPLHPAFEKRTVGLAYIPGKASQAIETFVRFLST